jgi:hypothetical protein
MRTFLSTNSQQSSIPPRLTGPKDWPRFGISLEGGILTGAGQELSIIPDKGLGARGNIDSDPTCDEWTIDDRRNLMNTVNDVQN